MVRDRFGENSIWYPGPPHEPFFRRVLMTETPIAISNTTLTKAKLAGVNLVESILTDVKFFDCDLSEMDFEGAQLTRVTFHNCDFNRASFDFARFVDCEFDVVPAFFATFEGAVFNGCTFRYLDLSRANLQSSSLEKCHFSAVDVDHTDFSFATFVTCDFESPTVGDAGGVLYAMGGEVTNFSNSTFRDMESGSGNIFRINCPIASFKRAAFLNVNLRQAVLPHADFSGAKFENVDLTGANLEGAKFQSAMLENVSFANADLSSADFSELEPEDSHEARTLVFMPAPDEQPAFQRVSFAQANLNSAEFAGAVLDHCDFTGADASGANFWAATFKSCVLTDMDWSGASPGADETTESSRRALYDLFIDHELALPYAPCDDQYDFSVRAPWLVHSPGWNQKSTQLMADPARFLATREKELDAGFSVALIDYENGAVRQVVSYAYVGWRISVAIRLLDGARNSPLPLNRAWQVAMHSLATLDLAVQRAHDTSINLVYDEAASTAHWSITRSDGPSQTASWQGAFADVTNFFIAAIAEVAQ